MVKEKVSENTPDLDKKVVTLEEVRELEGLQQAATPEVSQPQSNSDEVVTVVYIGPNPYAHKNYGPFNQGEPRYVPASTAKDLIEIKDDSGNALFKQL